MDKEQVTPGQVLEAFLRTRDLKEAMEAKHKTELAPIKTALDNMETWLQDHMNKNGIDQVKVAGVGVAFKKRKTSVRCEDWDGAFFPWIEQHKAWHFLDHNVNKTAAVEYMDQHQVMPPGVSITTFVEVQVNRERGT